jgi:hypothetical protein
MFVLQIEHEVLHFEGWKKAFDSDPLGRKKMGVKEFEIFSRTDNQNYIVINLWFEQLDQAEMAVAPLRSLWEGPGGKVMMNPQLRILNLIERQETLSGQ